MPQPYSIVPTTIQDLDFIYFLFDEAIAYQKRKGYPLWPDYDKDVLQNDIAKNLQFKILIDNQIACIFSLCASDPVVWHEMEKGDALYLHRIVVNPKFKGQQQFGKLLEWSKPFAKEKGLLHLRMDTWANNPPLVNYYLHFGFEVTGYFTTPNNDTLPIQQRGNEVVLLEYSLETRLN